MVFPTSSVGGPSALQTRNAEASGPRMPRSTGQPERGGSSAVGQLSATNPKDRRDAPRGESSGSHKQERFAWGDVRGEHSAPTDTPRSYQSCRPASSTRLRPSQQLSGIGQLGSNASVTKQRGKCSPTKGSKRLLSSVEMQDLSHQASADTADHRTKSRYHFLVPFRTLSRSSSRIDDRRLKYVSSGVREEGKSSVESERHANSRSLLASLDGQNEQESPIFSRANSGAKHEEKTWSRHSSRAPAAEDVSDRGEEDGEKGEASDTVRSGTEGHAPVGNKLDVPTARSRVFKQPEQTKRSSSKSTVEPRGPSQPLSSVRRGSKTLFTKQHSTSKLEEEPHSPEKERNFSSVRRPSSSSKRTPSPSRGLRSGNSGKQRNSSNQPGKTKHAALETFRKTSSSGGCLREESRERRNTKTPYSTATVKPQHSRTKMMHNDSGGTSPHKHRSKYKRKNDISTGSKENSPEKQASPSMLSKKKHGRRGGSNDCGKDRHTESEARTHSSRTRDLDLPEKTPTRLHLNSNSRGSSRDPGRHSSTEDPRERDPSRRRYERSPPKTLASVHSQKQDGEGEQAFSSNHASQRPPNSEAISKQNPSETAKRPERSRETSLERCRQQPESPRKTPLGSKNLCTSLPSSSSDHPQEDSKQSRKRDGNQTRSLSRAPSDQPGDDSEAVGASPIPPRKHRPEQILGRAFSGDSAEAVTEEELSCGPAGLSCQRSKANSRRSLIDHAVLAGETQGLLLEQLGVSPSLYRSVGASDLIKAGSKDNTGAAATLSSEKNGLPDDSGLPTTTLISKNLLHRPDGGHTARTTTCPSHDRSDFAALVRAASRSLQTAQEILARSRDNLLRSPSLPPTPATPVLPPKRSSEQPHSPALYSEEGPTRTNQVNEGVVAKLSPERKFTNEQSEQRCSGKSDPDPVSRVVEAAPPCTDQTLVCSKNASKMTSADAAHYHKSPLNANRSLQRPARKPQESERMRVAAGAGEFCEPAGNYTNTGTLQDPPRGPQETCNSSNTAVPAPFNDSGPAAEPFHSCSTEIDTGLTASSHCNRKAYGCPPRSFHVPDKTEAEDIAAQHNGLNQVLRCNATSHRSPPVSLHAGQEYRSPYFMVPLEENVGITREYRKPPPYSPLDLAKSSSLYTRSTEVVPTIFSSGLCPSSAQRYALKTSTPVVQPFGQSSCGAKLSGLEAATSEAEPFGKKTSSLCHQLAYGDTRILWDSPSDTLSRYKQVKTPMAELPPQSALETTIGREFLPSSPAPETKKHTFPRAHSFRVSTGTLPEFLAISNVSQTAKSRFD
ncbi:putative proteophosphoglycan protein ppg4 [Toxoplasma gondii MAS]|uniref:Putative proteophosphoglycan protein ppg4 n=2 Tax=Toxoplasma gondii TaxID=5811 RepID=A0A086Q434_TOXGO|nr:putative proteophosphoglycan protein ppg4 [Toxoplasma gondii MAS]PUA90216.1 putative proteophosphoglycan protein ppg4 [Toxoplasma gondii TgCATBr9]